METSHTLKQSRMKRTLIAKIACIAVVAVVSTTTLMAQERQSPLQRYGVKAGIQLTKIPLGDASDSWDFKLKPGLGFQVGGFATFGLSEDFSLQTELFLSVQRYSETSTLNVVGGDMQEVTSKYSDRYLKLPVLLRYRVAEKFFVEAGPQFALFVSSNIEKDEWVHYQKLGIAAALGAEYLLTDQFSVQFRYAQSFAKIDNAENYLWISERPRVFSLGLAYAF